MPDADHDSLSAALGVLCPQPPAGFSTSMAAHPAAALFPMLDEARLALLADDIKREGLKVPIVLLDGQILDGRNRWRACEMAGVEPRFVQFDGGNPWRYVLSLNAQRRDLDPGQRAAIVLKGQRAAEDFEAQERRRKDEANRKRAEAAREQPKVQTESGSRLAPKPGVLSPDKTPGPTKARDMGPAVAALATTAGVSAPTAARVQSLANQRPELFEQVAAGTLGLAEATRQMKRAQVVAKLEDTAAKAVKAAHGVYDVIVLDPPWPMQKIELEVRPNQVGFDYPTMSEAELAALEIPAADDCHIWLWTTQKFLPMAFRLLTAWGLKYVCTFVWHKPGGFQVFGLPQYNCEFALYARKGAPQFVETKALPTAFCADRGAHSEKPEHFYELVRRVTAGRRLDMFNRRLIDGFDGWGQEAAQ